jgi:hypothetical protein
MTKFGSFQRTILRFMIVIPFFAPIGAYAETLWAAVAVSPDGAGWAWDVHGGKDAALAAARAKCAGACDLSHSGAFSDGCVSIYKHADPSAIGYGFQGGDTTIQAQSNAMNACQKKYTNCQLHATVCQSN